MGKKFKKLLAAALSLAMLFTFCMVPMTASAETPADETYETPTEIEFTDLIDGGNHLSGEKSMGVGSKAFTFEADTYSNVVKFTWIAGVTATNEFKVSFDEVGDQISDPFGFAVKASSGATSVDTVVFQNGLNTATKKLDAPVVKDDEHDIELGRKKVLTGSNAGKYYVYLKFDGELIGSEYVSVNENNQYTASGSTVTMAKSIRFVTYGRGGADKIKEMFVPETYEDATEIGFTDLIDGGNHLSGEKSMGVGSKAFTFEADTYSNVVKFTWIAGVTATNEFKVSFDEVGDQISDPFGFAVKASSGATSVDTVVFQNGLNTATKKLDAPVVKDDEHDIELGRKKVLTGSNAGKYYVYLKFDGELIGSEYVSVNENNQYTASGSTVTMAKSIRFVTYGRGGADKIKEMFVPETYEDATEIGFTDLIDGGNHLSDEKSMGVGSKAFTFEADTYSNVVKFTWIAGVTATNEFKVSFDEVGDQISDPFGFAVKASSGATSVDTVVFQNGLNTATKKLAAPIVKDDEHTIELGRKKVLTGKNAGKYYVYLKFDDELIGEGYVSVDGNNQYTASGSTVTMAKSIRFVTYGRGGADKIKVFAIPEVDPDPDALYYAYDEIGYADLKNANGNDLGNETGVQGATIFKYNKTSATGSAILKLRWKGANAGSEFQISFDKIADGPKMDYMFGVQYYKPSDEYPNGRVWLRPGYGPQAALTTPIEHGGNYDIEFARLKVKNGPNAGKYYVYFKMGDIFLEDYVDADVVDSNGNYTSNPGPATCTVSNEIFMSFWGGGGGNKIGAVPVPETYEAYDEIDYADLIDANGNPLPATEFGVQTSVFTYNKTSPTGSAILKFRWKEANAASNFQICFDKIVDDNGPRMAYMFGVQYYVPDANNPNGKTWLRPGYGPESALKTALVSGNNYDIEFARLKVANGPNKGKYYVYLKINDVLIADDYVAANVVDANGNYTSNPNSTSCTISNEIYLTFWGGGGGNKIAPTPFVQEYEAYDEIGYEDLIDANGNPLPENELGVQTSVFTYNKTSPTNSAILKFRWKKANAASNFQICFDKIVDDNGPRMAYMFGVQYYVPDTNNPNGKVWLRPSYGPELALKTAFVSGNNYNIEFARLKVKNGPNKGKYYVYLKINDELIAEDYIAADVVDANGNYISNPNSTSCTISNEIYLTFWGGGGGNKISPYQEGNGAIEPEGTIGDFDNSGVIDVKDVVVLRRVLLGTQDTSEMPVGIADFNGDGEVDIRDLIAIKEYLAPVNSYEKTGSLTLGMQEHLLEDYTKTADYIADASATLGATSYRLSTPIHTLYYATSNNGVEIKEDNMNEFKAMVAALKAKGINEILYVTDSFILPYGYSNPTVNHNITVPDPKTDTENYIAWLTVNAAAFKALAQEVPEIKFFEPFNEINTKGTRFETYGCPWEATEEQKAAHKFTVKEKAAIMADLCWYISDAVKSVDVANQVTTPSIVVGSNSVIENDFIDEFYKAIESGLYPTNKSLCDVRVDNYFTIVNLHAYPGYAEDNSWLDNNFESNAAAEINAWAGYINGAYDVVKAHNDGGSRVWLTETGMSTYHSDGKERDMNNVARLIELALEKLDNDLTFIDSVIFYKIADISSDRGASPSETNFGLFYSGDDLDNPYAAKPSAKAVYSYFHNGTTDYSALDALVGRYYAE